MSGNQSRAADRGACARHDLGGVDGFYEFHGAGGRGSDRGSSVSGELSAIGPHGVAQTRRGDTLAGARNRHRRFAAPTPTTSSITTSSTGAATLRPGSNRNCSARRCEPASDRCANSRRRARSTLRNLRTTRGTLIKTSPRCKPSPRAAEPLPRASPVGLEKKSRPCWVKDGMDRRVGDGSANARLRTAWD